MKPCLVNYRSTIIGHTCACCNALLLRLNFCSVSVIYQEHAALGDTNLIVTSEFRAVMLNVLVSAMDVEAQLGKAERLFSVKLCVHPSSVTTVWK